MGITRRALAFLAATTGFVIAASSVARANLILPYPFLLSPIVEPNRAAEVQAAQGWYYAASIALTFGVSLAFAVVGASLLWAVKRKTRPSAPESYDESNR